MIRSVRGDLVAPEDVGLTLPHEHVLHTIGSKAASKADLEIKMEDLIVYRRSPFAFGGRNLQLQNEDEAFRELEKLQQLAAAIGQTRKPLVVDVALPIEGRDALAKQRLHLAERLSGLHLLTVTTFEIERINDAFSIGLPPKEQSERIARVLEAELMFGIESGGAVAYPGAMYQQIQSSELGPKERILVQGLALAQARTHAPLYLSFSEASSRGTMAAVQAWFQALLDAGAESKKLVLCHVDRFCQEHALNDFVLELLDLGVSVMFDMIGLPAVSDAVLVNPCLTSAICSSDFLESDAEEPPPERWILRWIPLLIANRPHATHQILLSSNVLQRIQYRRYGGGGYTYLFEIFKQRLLMQGVTTAQWDQIVCGNVVDLLAWYVAPEAPPIPKNYLQCSICGNYFEPIEGEYFTKFAFIYCGTKCLRRHSRQKFAPLPTKT
ncbi:hypothetical protein PRNP1_011234 [Phytophthora ramorum]